MQNLLSPEDFGIVFSMLDEVVWLFNIRGADVEFNPVVYAFAVVTREKAFLFIEPSKLSSEVIAHLLEAKVDVLPYDSIEEFLTNARTSDKGFILADSTQINWRLANAIGDKLKEKASPLTLAKSLKNKAELSGVVQSHIRDGLALTAFLSWLDREVVSGKQITEYEASVVLESYR